MLTPVEMSEGIRLGGAIMVREYSNLARASKVHLFQGFAQAGRCKACNRWPVLQVDHGGIMGPYFTSLIRPVIQRRDRSTVKLAAGCM
jgi:hypothetical protein